MRKNKEATEEKEITTDADLSLRSTSRLFPGVLAQLIIAPDEPIRRMHWGETQVSARARRLDRVLYVRLARRGYRLLHIEWTLRLNGSVRERAAEYHLLLAKTARRELHRRRMRKRRLLVTVETVIVVLSGRKKPWKAFGRYQTSPKGKRFTGIRFRIEPVYQRTVAELEARSGIFWLVFVPLATDADEPQISRIVQRVRREATTEEFSEVVATMLSMARVRKDRPEFENVIRAAEKEEEVMAHPWFVDGRNAGIKIGREEGLEEGREEGREEGLAALAIMVERRLGRVLTAKERRRIVSRLAKDGPEKLATAVMDLSPKKLAVWLKPRRVATTLHSTV